MRSFAIAVTIAIGGAAGLLAAELPSAPPAPRPASTLHKHEWVRQPAARPPQFIISSFDGSGGLAPDRTMTRFSWSLSGE
jgi:hypothetical protein